MIKFRKQIILCFTIIAVSFLFLNLDCAKASNFFSREKYNIPEGKSILLSPEFKNPDKKYNWHSENSSVVSVDSKGIAYAKSRGTATIKVTDKNGKNISKCVVEVGEREPFRIVYSSSNVVNVNENFKLKAITYKDVESLKFEVTGENYSKTFECKSKSNYLDYYVWEHSVKLPHNGSYNIKAYAKIGNSWKTCAEANAKVLVSEKYDRKKMTLNEKMVSRECADMIAAWEGSCPRVYKDASGILTIGYGKRIYPYEIFYNNLSPAEMSNMFLQALNHSSYARSVNKFLCDNKIKFNQQQFDALVSFSYNLGCGWLYSNSGLSRIILECSGNCAKNDKVFYRGIVNSSNGLCVREQPSTSSKKLSTLGNGETVEIIDSNKINGKWYKIKTNNGINGYCYGDYMELIKSYGGEKSLNDINRDKFAKEFLSYHHVCRRCNKGLFKRRVEELDIFFKNKYERAYNFKRLHITYPIPECVKKLCW